VDWTRNEEDFYDLWIMDKFNVLPTDERLMNLEFEQKEALFERLNSLAELKNIKLEFLKIKEVEKIKKMTSEQLMSVGLRKRVTESLRMQGVSEDKIIKKINEQVEDIRKAKLLELEHNDGK